MEARKLIATPEWICAARRGEFRRFILAITGHITANGSLQSVTSWHGGLFNVGDRVYLAEEWTYYTHEVCAEGGYSDPVYAVGRSDYEEFTGCNGSEKWFPADTMPIEAAKWWFRICTITLASLDESIVIVELQPMVGGAEQSSTGSEEVQNTHAQE